MHELSILWAQHAQTGDLYGMIVDIINILPCASLVMVAVLFTMIGCYATNFDSIDSSSNRLIICIKFNE